MNMGTEAINAPEGDGTGILKSSDTKQQIPRGGGIESLQSLLTIVIIAIFVITFVVQAFQIPSESMEDTLLVGDYLLVDKFSFSPAGQWSHLLPYQHVQHGDIIVFRWPLHPDQHFVKRVIGLPGDRVRLVNGKVFVNGTAPNDVFAVHKMANRDAFRDDFPNNLSNNLNVTPAWWNDIPYFTRDKQLVVPRDCFFVLGDNRDESSDSRYWGFVPRENVVGKPLLVYFSVRHYDDERMANGADGKIVRFMNHILKLPSMARWSRTFRFVR